VGKLEVRLCIDGECSATVVDLEELQKSKEHWGPPIAIVAGPGDCSRESSGVCRGLWVDQRTFPISETRLVILGNAESGRRTDSVELTLSRSGSTVLRISNETVYGDRNDSAFCKLINGGCGPWCCQVVYEF
jgi:hypothetical protein